MLRFLLEECETPIEIRTRLSDLKTGGNRLVINIFYFFIAERSESNKNGHVGRPGPRPENRSACPQEWADVRKK